MTSMTINDDKCWMCGDKKNLTMHHALSTHMKPLHNVLIPVCRTCHDDKINAEDVAGLTAFTYKLMKQMQKMSMQMSSLYKNVEGYTDIMKKKQR